ncbi:Conserved_hypothetical protein [Hexamita inflata]|uniref:Uncharacterized protein n=1 Tax=Hexamita inflata TaxID=28002 RepID=A0AA86Q1T9_9EUKA|nr:Conserved hypothetical protein [Hexamita inflata]
MQQFISQTKITDNTSCLEALNTPHMYKLLKQYQADITNYSLQFIRAFSNSVDASLNSFLVESCYNVRSYQKALQFYKLLQKQNKDIKDVAQLESELLARVQEQTSGLYVFDRLFELVNGSPFPRIEASDYTSPKLKLKQNYFVSTGDILPGDILLVEKALVYSNEQYYADAVPDLTEQLKQNVEPFQEPESVYAILSDRNIKPVPLENVEQFIQPLFNYQVQNRKFTLNKLNECFGYAVYYGLNKIRNSCNNNASVSFMGDLMIIIANQAVKAGECIKINKFSQLNAFCFKDEYEINQMDFCDCFICSHCTKQQFKSWREQQLHISKLITEQLILVKQDKFDKMNTSRLCDAIVEFEESLDRLKISKNFRTPILPSYALLIDFMFRSDQPFLGRQYCTKYLEQAGFIFAEIVKSNFELENGRKIGFSENIFFVVFKMIRFNLYIITNGLDKNGEEKYQSEINALRQFAEFWSKRSLGWGDIAEWKYME